jgi:hypothetical protein
MANLIWYNTKVLLGTLEEQLESLGNPMGTH